MGAHIRSNISLFCTLDNKIILYIKIHHRYSKGYLDYITACFEKTEHMIITKFPDSRQCKLSDLVTDSNMHYSSQKGQCSLFSPLLCR